MDLTFLTDSFITLQVAGRVKVSNLMRGANGPFFFVGYCILVLAFKSVRRVSKNLYNERDENAYRMIFMILATVTCDIKWLGVTP